MRCPRTSWPILVAAATAVVVLEGCHSARGTEQLIDVDDAEYTKLAGGDYLCGKKIVVGEVCLDLLLPECELVVEGGNTIPPQASERLALWRDGERITTVLSPGDLSRCVEIDTSGAAVKYLRFFSSYRTVHLFEKQQLEIYRSNVSCFVCLDNAEWDRHRLVSPAVTKTLDGYEVERVVMQYCRGREYCLFNVKEMVSLHGEVRMVEQEEIPWDEEWILMFPLLM